MYTFSDFSKPHIVINNISKKYLFYCDSSKDELINSKALKYIISGENRRVNVRGKGYSVIAYQNKKQIQNAKRQFWYDSKTEVDKKEIFEILLPRFIFKNYFPIWNEAKYIPSGAILQFFPNKNEYNLVYLAILTSSFMEISFRISSQVYGGGTTNFKLSNLKECYIIDADKVSDTYKEQLIKAYKNFLKSNDRKEINNIIYNVLELSNYEIIELENLLVELQ